MNKNIIPLVSIIIPVYNVELYLRDCLDSVVNQSLRDIEIICVNDGSMDGSLAILHEYAELDRRIKIIDKPNEGQSVARNLALSLASGKYVAFVDSDDFIDQDLCMKALDLAEKHHCDVVLYDYLKFQNEVEISLKRSKPSALTSIRASDKNAILSGMGVVWTKFVLTDFIRTHKISFPEGFIYEDSLVHWQFVTLAKKIAILPERLYFYRVQPSSTTQRTDWKRTDYVFICDLIREFLMRQNLYERYRDFFIYFEINNFYILYDTIDPVHQQNVMKLILGRMTNEHWEYVYSTKSLGWKTQDFFLAHRGSYFAKTRRYLWLVIRMIYRKIMGCYR